MHKLLSSVLLSFTLAVSCSAWAHEGEDHSHEEEAAAESTTALESGKGWKVIRNVEIGTSGKFIQLVLVDHSVYTDKTVYSSAIYRLCRADAEFCRIRFWSEERFVPEKASLTIEQNKQLRAEYLVNKSAGTKQLRWSCTVDTDRTHCF